MPGPREPWPAPGCTHGTVYRGKPGPARMPAPGVPGHLALGQPAWGRYLRGQRELAGRPGREKGVHVPAGPGSWPARGTGWRVSLQKERCRAQLRPGQAQQRTGPGGPRSSYRAPRSGVPALASHRRFHGTGCCCHNRRGMARCWAARLAAGKKSICSWSCGQHIFEGLARPRGSGSAGGWRGRRPVERGARMEAEAQPWPCAVCSPSETGKAQAQPLLEMPGPVVPDS